MAIYGIDIAYTFWLTIPRMQSPGQLADNVAVTKKDSCRLFKHPAYAIMAYRYGIPLASSWRLNNC
jgi:hypothetical protein